MFKPRSRSTSIALFAIAGLSSAAAHAQYVVNGSFESVAGVVPANGFLTLAAGSTALTGWTIGAVVPGASSIDVVDKGYFVPPAGGNYVVDLVGTPGAGSISQSLALPTGQYHLNFDYAGNFESGDPFKAAYVQTGNSYSVIVDFGTPGSLAPGGTPAWKHASFLFDAIVPPPTTLAFTNIAGGQFSGVLLDNVNVTAVPEPESYALMLAGLAMMGGIARRRLQQRR
ncbi:MAG: DUF642 domain-containing protein [Sterolibacteriaceae bacterium]|nr:DUF642 domain-containing protein [Sterolibacteriaceae bacterium]MBK9085417.1 DUF642 domain-containing protein [Sterolibacteriaceae bacterium]